MPIGVIAKLTIHPGKNSSFEQAFLNYQNTVITQEPGNIFFCLHQSRDDSCIYTVIEQYVDQAALNLHQNADYYKAIPATFKDFMSGPPEIQILDSVSGG